VEDHWTPGARLLCGIGPREGLPPGVVWPARRGSADGPTEWETRSGAYRRVGGGLWVSSAVEQHARQRVVEAAARLPAYGGVTGWAALCWSGGRWFDGTGPHFSERPPTLALGSRHSLRPSAGVRVSQELVPVGEIRRVRGLRLTSPLWSVAFEMRHARTYEDAVSSLWIRKGVQRVRDLLPILEENSWSPTEPLMRRTWQTSGFGRPQANCPVFDLAGRLVGTPDLLDVEAGVYGMYDGGLHLAGSVRHADIGKEASYRALGLEGVTMMSSDLPERGPFVQRLREAYDRAGRRPAEDRRWMKGLPAWWTPTFTVEQRRALSAYERSRVLRYREAS
jgi:hypothetical protein